LGEANVLKSLGDLERRLGHVEEARRRYEQALPLYQQEQGRLGEANVLKSLGDLESRLGHVEEARRRYEQALPLYQQEQDRLGEANVYRSFADVFLVEENYTEARSWYEQALALYQAEQEPFGQAVSLFQLGQIKFSVGEHEQGMDNVQQALTFFQRMQHYEEAHSAEQMLSRMQQALAQLDNTEGIISSSDAQLLNAFATTSSSQELLQLVQQYPQLLSDRWLALIDAFLATHDDTEIRQALEQRLATLKEWKQGLEAQLALSAQSTEHIIKFIGADWITRRQMLTEQADVLLSDGCDTSLDLLVAANPDEGVRQTLEQTRTLLGRGRQWGIESALYLYQSMRLGDDIDIPADYETDLERVATLLARREQGTSALDQAVEAMATWLNRLPENVPPLLKAALMRDLAEAIYALPVGHPARVLEHIVGYCQEALPAYREAERLQSVAYLQRFLGRLFIEQGRLAEAIEALHEALKILRASDNEQHRQDAVWTAVSCAEALEYLGRSEEALTTYGNAIALQPDLTPLYRNRAEVLIGMRRLEEAELDLSRAVELDDHEESSYLWYRRAQMAIARGDGHLAARMLDEATKRDATVDIAYERALSSWLCGNVETAKTHLAQAHTQASALQRPVIRRTLQQVIAEHPDLSGGSELMALLEDITNGASL
jgi:tetratricopeptide (TPR) repeat protein